MSEKPEHVTYGFVGLGHQGTPMAQHMIDRGLRPWLWARRSAILDRYRQTDARIATSLAELGARCDVIGLCLYDADASESVLFGPAGLVTAVRRNTVLAIHSTVGPDYIEGVVSRTAPRGINVVDAPVSGGDLALARQLLVVVGGEEKPCAPCIPMFDTYAGRVAKVAATGAAQAAKVVNNALMMAMAGMVIDAFDLGRRLGIDLRYSARCLRTARPRTPPWARILSLAQNNSRFAPGGRCTGTSSSTEVFAHGNRSE
jgi:3-hydroxyisobutyrate dehydrogenase